MSPGECWCRFWFLNIFFSCLRFFLSNFSSSFLAISSGSMGSPLQVVGWELWAGLPGPFLVFSFFLHLALRFWNQTYTPNKENQLTFSTGREEDNLLLCFT
ncbi:hypothetical protein XELAEV_18002774mg [Xenopus laevis]|uniref:Uncharacterized protein n=1 Tax=Xenopus laevis TaxID=8355 RepID=A0A974BNF6_XENLA|nr:hypothetical protein XELAEV_18002774mg [Xenopus laevis]